MRSGEQPKSMNAENDIEQTGDPAVVLKRLVRLLVANHTPEELALGYLRYEAVRKMSPRTFGELHKLNLSGKFFDSLVDEALQSWKQPGGERGLQQNQINNQDGATAQRGSGSVQRTG